MRLTRRPPPPIVVPDGKAVHKLPCDRCKRWYPPEELDILRRVLTLCWPCVERIYGSLELLGIEALTADDDSP